MESPSPFASRVQKNLRHLRRWLRNHEIHCYRAYDRDVPEYPLVVDVYEDRVHVQEFAAAAGADPAKVAARRAEALAEIPALFEVPAEHVHFKTRRRQKGSDQYRRTRTREKRIQVREGPGRFWVDLTAYLDSGLFLDHRSTRDLVREMADGKRFLNLFCYTATFTVHAALGGARETTSVDLSRTYLHWARLNLELNGVEGPRHRLIEADCVKWLRKATGRYDLIVLDPPTFSNSKSMKKTLDVQRDHVRLIRDAVQLLDEDGLLLFSTNHQRFRLDRDALKDLDVRDLTRATLPKDFERNPRVHQCWKIRRGS